MVLHQFATAGVEHFRSFWNFLDVSNADSEVDVTAGPRLRNLHLGGSPVAMTLAMLSGFISPDSPIWELARHDPDALEYEVSATMLLLYSLDDSVFEQVVQAGWLRIPLTKWISCLKPSWDLIRRSGMIGSLKSDLAYQLRKIGSVTERRDKEADWDAERYNKCSAAVFKFMCAPGLNYARTFCKIARRRIKHTTMKIAQRPDSGDLAWWWKRRHHHIPGGSCSAGRLARRALREDRRFGVNDRAGKKTLSELLPNDFYEQLLHFPPLNVARASTKKEPGGKYRALYANNDISYLVSAFEAVHGEKVMDDGVCARQGIEDFMNWIQQATQEGYHLSTDYSDYNSEHMLQELALLDLLRASSWLGTSAPYRYEKAAAALWGAAGKAVSFIEYGKTLPEMRRAICGLYSGHRNTMRDHCDKHYTDVRVALEDARALGYECNLKSSGSASLAGDDEHVVFTNLHSAVVYGNVTAMEGHQLNSRKQLAGRAHAEFLQVMAHPGSTLQRPLAAILMTLASGNWYVPSGSWYDNMPQGMADAWWESHCRGLPYVAAFHMACAYLDVGMRVPTGDSYMALEWWSYRSPDKPHPLWGVVTKKAPIVRQLPKPRSVWPCNATDAWMTTVAKQLAQLPARKRDRYREELLQISHGSAFGTYRQEILARNVGEQWPRRMKRWYRPPTATPAQAFSVVEMLRFAAGIGMSTRPRDEDELVSRLGVDPALASMSGTFAVLAPTLKGRDWAQFASILPRRSLTPRAAASAWAFRSWASRSDTTTSELHAMCNRDARKHVVYVYAPNGAGKTTLCRRYPEIVDFDSLVAPVSALRIAYRRSHNAPNASRIVIMVALKRAMLGCGSVVRILGNYPTSMIEQSCKELDIPCITGDYLPGWDVCRGRLRQRGPEYTEERIDQLQARYIPGPYQFPSIAELKSFMKI